jgi:hypothetical protein
MEKIEINTLSSTPSDQQAAAAAAAMSQPEATEPTAAGKCSHTLHLFIFLNVELFVWWLNCC